MPVISPAVTALGRVEVLTALVAVETVVLALLALLLIGLLRSHAEILRRLPDTAADADHAEHAGGPGERANLPAHLPGPRGAGGPVVDIVGSTLDGAQMSISPAKTDTLVAFLSSGCLTCKTFWDGLRADRREPLPQNLRLLVVVKDPEMESPSRLRDLAPSDIPVVMSSQAWTDYDVAMSPYFLFIEAAGGTVRSEGSASSWEQVHSLLRDAIEDDRLMAQDSTGSRPGSRT
jgi:hypothetical protein